MEVSRGSGFTIVEEGGGGVRDGFEMRREMKIEGREDEGGVWRETESSLKWGRANMRRRRYCCSRMPRIGNGHTRWAEPLTKIFKLRVQHAFNATCDAQMVACGPFVILREVMTD